MHLLFPSQNPPPRIPDNSEDKYFTFPHSHYAAPKNTFPVMWFVCSITVAHILSMPISAIGVGMFRHSCTYPLNLVAGLGVMGLYMAMAACTLSYHLIQVISPMPIAVKMWVGLGYEVCTFWPRNTSACCPLHGKLHYHYYQSHPHLMPPPCPCHAFSGSSHASDEEGEEGGGVDDEDAGSEDGYSKEDDERATQADNIRYQGGLAQRCRANKQLSQARDASTHTGSAQRREFATAERSLRWVWAGCACWLAFRCL